jgi:class 3 adenylate cyclase
MRMLASFGQMSADQHEFISKTVASAVYGFDNSDAAAELAATLQKAATPDVVHAYRESFRTTDVRPLLGQIRCPTLVLFDRNFMGEDEESSRELARSIPGARLVMFASEGPDQAAATCAEAVDDFLRSIGSVPQAVAATTPKAIPSGMAVVLFTDIADSTGLTERMGDAAFRNHARALDDALRKIITTNGGTPIDGKLLGDGVLATFAAASQAIAAALACDAACDNTPLRLHLGIHAGDVIREQNNVFGGAVNIAARISALAAPGEILVSATVRDLARTSAGVSFEDRGDHALKGIAEPLRVFAVRAAGVGS